MTFQSHVLLWPSTAHIQRDSIPLADLSLAHLGYGLELLGFGLGSFANLGLPWSKLPDFMALSEHISITKGLYSGH